MVLLKHLVLFEKKGKAEAFPNIRSHNVTHLCIKTVQLIKTAKT